MIYCGREILNLCRILDLINMNNIKELLVLGGCSVATLEKGMYVRCPIDEDINNPRLFVLGQVTSIDDDKVTVTFMIWLRYDNF